MRGERSFEGLFLEYPDGGSGRFEDGVVCTGTGPEGKVTPIITFSDQVWLLCGVTTVLIGWADYIGVFFKLCVCDILIPLEFKIVNINLNHTFLTLTFPCLLRLLPSLQQLLLAANFLINRAHEKAIEVH